MNHTDVQNVELRQQLSSVTKAQSATPKSKVKPKKRKRSAHEAEEEGTVEKTSDEVNGDAADNRASNVEEVAALKGESLSANCVPSISLHLSSSCTGS